MIALLSVERIKLLSTRSPYWCTAAILAASLAFALLFGLVEHGANAVPSILLSGVGLSQYILMVMAALAMTTEYRFSTIRTTFLAAPHRTAVLTAKTVLLALIGGLVGEICAFGAFFLTKALATQPPAPLVLQGDVWRQVAGHGALFAVSAVFAVAVGTLLRQSAGAVTLLLLWPLLLEQLIGIIPKVGEKIGPWLPFRAGTQFVAPDETIARTQPGPVLDHRAHTGPGAAGPRRLRPGALGAGGVRAPQTGCVIGRASWCRRSTCTPDPAVARDHRRTGRSGSR